MRCLGGVCHVCGLYWRVKGRGDAPRPHPSTLAAHRDSVEPSKQPCSCTVLQVVHDQLIAAGGLVVLVVLVAVLVHVLVDLFRSKAVLLALPRAGRVDACTRASARAHACRQAESAGADAARLDAARHCAVAMRPTPTRTHAHTSRRPQQRDRRVRTHAHTSRQPQQRDRRGRARMRAQASRHVKAATTA
eukprot:364492-Chlamydomonas_euryale.AAC.7